MMHVPMGRLDSVRRNVVAAVEHKAEPDAAGFRHRPAECPHTIELSCTPTLDLPAFLRAERRGRKSGKVAVRLVVLDIDPDQGTHAESARQPSTRVRQRN